ncbi:CidA/LrgA family protein [Parabacteroides sp. Marseille-P3160]|uniref:CidA/LrgA family protein n=1 Tax=Parabacteroides sp. Marseille-P3160 TaxID=1917887 RepID=UPI0009BA16AE|nr:CidA/LrgA family protein [Parabacteroides sp. Marseille-P3160]
MLSQVFYVLFFYFMGEVISYFTYGIVPGSVIGMILLFLSLAFKLVHPDKVKRVANLLTQNMGFFFLPAGVGLMNMFGLLSKHWVVILTICMASTIMVIASVALVQEHWERLRKDRQL